MSGFVFRLSSQSSPLAFICAASEAVDGDRPGDADYLRRLRLGVVGHDELRAAHAGDRRRRRDLELGVALDVVLTYEGAHLVLQERLKQRMNIPKVTLNGCQNLQSF